MKVEVRLDPSLQPSSLAEGLQGGPRPPPVPIDGMVYWCIGELVGEGGPPAAPMMAAARGVRPMMVLTGEAYDGPHRSGGE